MNRLAHRYMANTDPLRRLIGRTLARSYQTFQRGCFWLSVVLPVGYLGVAIPGDAEERTAALIGLPRTHLVTLVIGHRHNAASTGNTGGRS
jgi:hypothetical protein